MATPPAPLKLYQIEEPDGGTEASDGIGLAVGIELSRLRGAAVAASVGGNAELVVTPAEALGASLEERDLAHLLEELRRMTEKAIARPVTHAVISLDGFAFADTAVLRAGAIADIAVMGVRRDGSVFDAAIEAEDLAALLSE
jgi:hypothetical protein